jgi:hypothetical protein
MSFTKDSAATTNRVSLATLTKWEIWHQDFKSKAVEPAATVLPPQSVTAAQVTIEEISPETASTDRPLPASRIVSTKSPTFGDLTVEG